MEKTSKIKVELDGLALEYQGDYGTAYRNVDVLNTVNNPTTECKICVFSLGLPQERMSGVNMIDRAIKYDEWTKRPILEN